MDRRVWVGFSSKTVYQTLSVIVGKHFRFGVLTTESKMITASEAILLTPTSSWSATFGYAKLRRTTHRHSTAYTSTYYQATASRRC
jgi:hypothetical protein